MRDGRGAWVREKKTMKRREEFSAGLDRNGERGLRGFECFVDLGLSFACPCDGPRSGLGSGLG